MSYSDNRRYRDDHDPDRPVGGYAADYYDDFPSGRDSGGSRHYNSRSVRRPANELRRRASSVGGDPSYDRGYYHRSQPSHSRRYKESRPRLSKYDSSSESSRSPRRRRRHNSGTRRASDHYDRRGRYSSSSRSRSRSSDRGRHSNKREMGEKILMHAALPVMAAGAAEALRSRKEPGEWRGNKGKHVLTTAVTNGLINKDPKKPQTHHVIDTTLSGLDGRQASKHRSRSQDRDGTSRTTNDIKKIAAAGALAWAGKEIYDRFDRSRSRARDRGYDSRYSDDGRRGSKKRSKSVSDYIHRGMAALGLEESNDRRRNRSKDRDGRSDRRERDYHRQRDYSDVDRDRGRSFRYDEYSDSDGDSDYRRDYLRRDRGSTDLTRTRSLNSSKPPTGAPRYIGYAETASHEDDCSCSNSDTDLGDSSDEKKKQKKLKRDMLLASGLATVASIHAAHGVYESVNKRKQRMQQLKNGEITPEQARKGRIKANTLDAASIGIAALGIKGAYGEWKEVNEKRKETNNFRHECVRRAVKRELKRERSTRGSSLPSHRSSNETQNTLENGYSGSHNVLSYHDGNPYGATTETPAITY